MIGVALSARPRRPRGRRARGGARRRAALVGRRNRRRRRPRTTPRARAEPSAHAIVAGRFAGMRRSTRTGSAALTAGGAARQVGRCEAVLRAASLDVTSHGHPRVADASDLRRGGDARADRVGRLGHHHPGTLRSRRAVASARPQGRTWVGGCGPQAAVGAPASGQAPRSANRQGNCDRSRRRGRGAPRAAGGASAGAGSARGSAGAGGAAADQEERAGRGIPLRRRPAL